MSKLEISKINTMHIGESTQARVGCSLLSAVDAVTLRRINRGDESYEIIRDKFSAAEDAFD